ncbi:MAG TPA: alpha-2-macroglobulin family protein, partial [Bacteroidales bacterium]|nr:alpha-2-macroglobulin family protein [Bacteroidales bacterium]
LYDLLASRALEFLTSDDAGYASPQEAQVLRQREELYYDARSFTALSLDEARGPLHAALGVYQRLLRIHSRGGKPLPLVDADLNRLSFVRQSIGGESADSLYRRALRELALAWRQQPVSVDVVYRLAQDLLVSGSGYDPSGDTTARWDKAEAMRLMEAAVKAFPSAFHAPHCRQLMKEMARPALDLQAANVLIPQVPSLALISHDNLKKVRLRIVAVEENQYRELLQSGRPSDAFAHLAALPILHNLTFPMMNEGDYQTHRVELPLPPLGHGHYALLASDADAMEGGSVTSFTSFWVSDLAYVTDQRDNGPLEVMVSSRSTGQPLASAIVSVYYRFYDYRSRKYMVSPGPVTTTDEQGMAVLQGTDGNGPERQAYLTLRYKTDFLSGEDYFYLLNRKEVTSRSRPECRIFTDRSVYRPGQVIWYKGIVYQSDEGQPKARTALEVKLRFLDANGQLVSETRHQTNDWGSFQGSFTAPSGMLTGAHTLVTDYGSVSVLVEEYKRPRFEVLFDSLEGEYRLGDTVSVPGRAIGYAGHSIGGARVSYRVVRSAWMPWYPWWDGWRMPWLDQQVQVAAGEAMTATDGTFRIFFPALPDPRAGKNRSPVYRYNLEVDVADISGEVRTGQTMVQVGRASLLIEADVPERVPRNAGHTYAVRTLNLMGRKVGTEVTLDIIPLPLPGRMLRPRLWNAPDQAYLARKEFVEAYPLDPYLMEKESWEGLEPLRTLTFDTRTEELLNLNALTYFPEGVYLLRFSARDKQGEKVVLEKRVELFSVGPGPDPFRQPLWTHLSALTAEPGAKVDLLLSTGAKRLRVLLEGYNAGGLKFREWVELKGDKLVYPIRVSEEDRGGLLVRYLTIHESRCYQGEFRLDVPRQGVALEIGWMKFRDRIEPGKPEEWRFTFKGDDGSKVLPELLLGMYDASLDAIAPHSWAFSIFRPGPGGRHWHAGHGFNLGWGRSDQPDRPYPGPLPERGYDRLKWFGLDFWFGGGGLRYMAAEGDIEMFDAGGRPEGAPNTMQKAKKSDLPPVQTVSESPLPATEGPSTKSFIRRDLAETAFFFPALYTDAEGGVTVSFTAPEALTRWNLFGLAHTPDLRIGQLNRSLITARDLMILPNLPRHLYEGDEIIIKARVANTGDNPLDGQAMLEVRDALSGKDLAENLGLTMVQDSFHLLPEGGAEVSWRLKVPPHTPLLQFTFSARSGAAADGEQHLLPVLSSRMLVTESRQLYVKGKSTLSAQISPLMLSQGVQKEPVRLSLEYTANPSWYVVQALPYLMDDDRSSADAVFNRFFSNSLARHIIRSHPGVKEVFRIWESYQPEALFSALEKNQDLKAVVLEETPWVREAQGEQAAKQAIGYYFKENDIEARLAAEWDALVKLQTPDGAWPWFPGMRVSRHITTEILAGLGFLSRSGALEMDASQVQAGSAAARYLLGEWVRDRQEILRQGGNLYKTYQPGSGQVFELYALIPWLGDIESNEATKEAWKYFFDRAGASWTTYPIQVQALLGLAALQDERRELADRIMASLNDRALSDADAGMYWRDLGQGYAWYNAPEGSMSRLVEFYHAYGAPQERIDAMRTWLLRKKQVRHWEGSRATAMACQAFLLKGSSWLVPDGEVSVRLGKEVLPSADPGLKIEAGTGHFRKDWAPGAITPDMTEVTVVSSSSSPSWGAVYFQYLAEMKDVLPQAEGLGLKRVLARVRTTGGQETLEAIEGKVLQPGDKIRVRLEITSGRSLDYVHLKDPRPALLEPADKVSGYRWEGGLGWYLSLRDVATHWYFEHLPQGTHVLEYDLLVSQEGSFTSGPASIQSLYAPEFGAHTGGTEWRSASGR